MHPMNEFEKSDGVKISYKEYYFRQYNKTIEDNDQPLLVSFLNFISLIV